MFQSLRATALALAVLPAAARAQAVAAPRPLAVAIDSIFAPYDRTSVPGCAVGVYDQDRLAFARGYGMADLEHGIPIGPQTVFYIASTSKQFAAASIALLEEEGKVSLRDPVRRWIPELPAYADPITVGHLVHHTSGLRDYLGLWALSGRSFTDEIPLEGALDLIARQRALDFAPGSRYSYSNSGYLLLAEIVHRASGRTLRDFAAERIFAPLEMTSTQFHDRSGRIVPRRAEGYQPAAGGGVEAVRTSFALVGDGGLLTTVEDLRRWDGNFYRNRLGRGDPALVRRLVTPPAEPLAGGVPQRYAHGLMPGTYRGLETVAHGGAFIGFRAELLRFPAMHVSVAVLCNDYTADPGALARRVADRWLAGRFPAATSRGAAPALQQHAPPPVALDRWAGRYEVLPGIVATVVRDSGGLRLAVMGRVTPLVATSDSTFVVSGTGEGVRFAATPAGPTMLGDAFGMWAPAPRLTEPPALSTAAAAQLAGRYTSDELDSWAVVRAEGDTLRLRVRHGAWQRLTPLANDTFTVPGARLTFTRDRRGAVTGFAVSQARTHNVAFTRASTR